MNMHYLKKYCRLAAVLYFLIASLFFPAGAYSADTPERPLEKLTIAYSSVSGNMAPLWITHERGFFRKNGLDVQIVFIESGSTAVQSLSNKDVAFAQMAGAGVLQSRLRGSDVVMIAGFLNTLDYQLMVEKSVTKPDQLKGKAMAVSRFGSSSDFATRYALEKLGLVPDKDVTILEIGTQPARFAALESGKIQAAMIAVPLTVRAKALGFRVLADLQMLGLEYQHTGLVTTQALIKSRPDLVRNVMRSYVEGIHYYKTNRPESIAILAKYLKTNDSELLNEVYTDLGLTLTPQKPYPTLRGIDIMLREMAARDAKAKAARPEDFVDLTFIKELDSSGYIDRLYKTQPVVATRQEPPAAAPSAASPKAPAQPKAAPPPAKVATAKTAPAAAAPSDAAQEYTVVSGDTLSHLASRFYGDHYQWNKIYEANKSTMRNPNFLFIGQKLFIPS
jgi:NitT/TauT family transport system substrate-binding protein